MQIIICLLLFVFSIDSLNAKKKSEKKFEETVKLKKTNISVKKGWSVGFCGHSCRFFGRGADLPLLTTYYTVDYFLTTLAVSDGSGIRNNILFDLCSLPFLRTIDFAYYKYKGKFVHGWSYDYIIGWRINKKYDLMFSIPLWRIFVNIKLKKCRISTGIELYLFNLVYSLTGVVNRQYNPPMTFETYHSFAVFVSAQWHVGKHSTLKPLKVKRKREKPIKLKVTNVPVIKGWSVGCGSLIRGKGINVSIMLNNDNFGQFLRDLTNGFYLFEREKSYEEMMIERRQNFDDILNGKNPLDRKYSKAVHLITYYLSALPFYRIIDFAYYRYKGNFIQGWSYDYIIGWRINKKYDLMFSVPLCRTFVNIKFKKCRISTGIELYLINFMNSIRKQGVYFGIHHSFAIFISAQWYVGKHNTLKT